ncbi:Cro/CI family transcriptional regulator [Methylophaga lonarensis]|uniref:Cro/CI family transcriptional regulator n=1 Tax=Methylophaga lonarensis TaxID=999151 RepID=UPI003D287D88
MDKQTVINFFGGAGKTAEALGISKQAVGQWPSIVPLGRQYQIELLTNGQLKAQKTAGMVKC